MKKYLNRDVFLILIGNMLADFLIPTLLFVKLLIKFGITENFFPFCLCLLGLFLYSVARPFILPVLYTYLGQKNQNDVIQIFIKSLKTSRFIKCLMLLITMIFSILSAFVFFIVTNCVKFNIKGFISIFLFYSIFNSYLILFLYWFIVDIIKHIKEQR